MDMIIHLDNFLLLKDMSKPGFMAISDPNFFKWIKNRHDVFGRWKNLFPTLVFLMRKYFLAPQRLVCKSLKNSGDSRSSENRFFSDGISTAKAGLASFLSTNRVWYPSKHFTSNTHLHPGILTIVDDRAEKEKISSKNREGSSRFRVPRTNPDFHFSEYKPHSEFTVKPVFSETSQILADTKLEKPLSSPFEIAPQFHSPPRTDQDKPHASSKGASRAAGHESMADEPGRRIHSETGRDSGRRSEIGTEGRDPLWQFPSTTTPQFPKLSRTRLLINGSWQGRSTTEVHRVLLSNSCVALRSLWFSETRFRAVAKSPPRTNPNETHTSGESVSQAAGYKHTPHKEGVAQRPVSDSHAPTMYYHSSMGVALDGLKESVADIEKKLAEGGGFIEKSGSNNPRISDRMSDTDNGNINLIHLTDQVYQMLERKIMIEKERRGL